jgi:hypothetical protein
MPENPRKQCTVLIKAGHYEGMLQPGLNHKGHTVSDGDQYRINQRKPGNQSRLHAAISNGANLYPNVHITIKIKTSR